jgi:hypothetical protein
MRVYSRKASGELPPSSKIHLNTSPIHLQNILLRSGQAALEVGAGAIR